MNQNLLIRFIAIAMTTILSSCASKPIGGLSSADRVGCHVIKIDSPSAMNGPSGQGTIVDLVVSSVVDAAIDSPERRQKEAEFANGIRAAIEDEFSKAGLFHYAKQSSLKGANNDANFMKNATVSEAGVFATNNNLKYALHVSVARGRTLDGLKDAPMLHFIIRFIDPSGKDVGGYVELVKGKGTSVWKAVNPRDPELAAAYQELARQAVRQATLKIRGA